MRDEIRRLAVEVSTCGACEVCRVLNGHDKTCPARLSAREGK